MATVDRKIKLVKSSLALRWVAPTPKFFKKVMHIGVTVGSICGSILVAQTQMPTVLPSFLIEMCKYGVTAGIIATVVAKFTVDETQIKESV